MVVLNDFMYGKFLCDEVKKGLEKDLILINLMIKVFDNQIIDEKEITGDQLFSKLNSLQFIKFIVSVEETFSIDFEDEYLNKERFVAFTEVSDYVLNRLDINESSTFFQEAGE